MGYILPLCAYYWEGSTFKMADLSDCKTKRNSESFLRHFFTAAICQSKCESQLSRKTNDNRNIFTLWPEFRSHCDSQFQMNTLNTDIYLEMARMISNLNFSVSSLHVIVRVEIIVWRIVWSWLVIGWWLVTWQVAQLWLVNSFTIDTCSSISRVFVGFEMCWLLKNTIFNFKLQKKMKLPEKQNI